MVRGIKLEYFGGNHKHQQNKSKLRVMSFTDDATYTPWSLEWLLEEPRLNVAKWSAEVVLCGKCDQVAEN